MPVSSLCAGTLCVVLPTWSVHSFEYRLRWLAIMQTEQNDLTHSHIDQPIRVSPELLNRTRTNKPQGSFLEVHPGNGMTQGSEKSCCQNISENERLISIVAGGVLAAAGLTRRSLPGLVVAGIGGALAYRGTSGHCKLYESLGVDTSEASQPYDLEHDGVHVTDCILVNKSSEELYNFWRGFEKLPSFMSHIISVRQLDDQHSEWTVKAPSIVGGQMTWKAKITTNHPNNTIEWETEPGSDVHHKGQVTFTRAPGDRGTYVKVELSYAPPAGQLGRWIAKLFGDEPEQQIRSDLRKFKQLMETGEVATVEGQPRGHCAGVGSWFGN